MLVLPQKRYLWCDLTCWCENDATFDWQKTVSVFRVLTRHALCSEKYVRRTWNAGSGSIFLLSLPFFVPWNSNRDLTGKRNELRLYVDSFLLCCPAICIFSVIDNDVLQPVQFFWVPATGPYPGANLPTRVNGKFIQNKIVRGLLVLLFCTGFECLQCLCPEEMAVQKLATDKRRCMGMSPSLFYKREGFQAGVA